MKKDGLFNVTMRAYDGAEVCELVGTFLLHKISEKYDKNSIGLYRDDGLSLFKNKSDTQLEIIKKNFYLIFLKFNWDTLHARLNSHYKAWIYKKKKHKKIKAYRKSL